MKLQTNFLILLKIIKKFLLIDFNLKLKTNQLINLTILLKKQDNNIKTDINNWLINKSDIIIPKNIAEILSLGGKFATPYNKKNYPLPKIIANIENSIYNVPNKVKNSIRNNVLHWIQNWYYKQPRMTFKQLQMERKIKETKQFLKNNPDLIITNADKSNKTVILKKQDYNEKVLDLLGDDNTYSKLKNNPTAKIQNTVKDLVDSWYKKEIINEHTNKYLKCTNGLAPKFYILPKLHKDNCLGRPITSFINSPLYNLSKLLANVLQKVVITNEYSIKDSWTLKKN